MKERVMYILITILIVIIGGLGFYSFSLNQKLDNLKNDIRKMNTNKEENKTQDKEVNEQKLILFNEEKQFAEMCINHSGICEESLGNFSLGENEYNFKIHYNMDDLYNNSYAANNPKEERLANYIILGNKRIDLNDGMSLLDKIVKINNDYLGIGINSISGGFYTINIYNKNLDFVKSYTSVNLSNENFSEYFKVKGNTFTRYECNTSLDDGTGTKQKLNTYEVIIKDNNFEEKLIKSINQFCSSQS